MKKFVILFVAISMLTIGISHAKTYIFTPQWVPQTQFAGYYVGMHKGIYKKHGIDLKVVDFNMKTSVPGKDQVSGKIHFGTQWLSSGLIMKQKGLNIVNIGQFFQLNGLTIIAKKKNGIKKLNDLKGKKIGTWHGVFRFPIESLNKKYKLRMKYIKQGFDMKELMTDTVDAATAMTYNELLMVKANGMKSSDLTVFRLYDKKINLNMPEDGIYVSEEFYRKNKDVCVKFVKASIEAWQWVFANKKEAVDIMMGYVAKSPFPTPRSHQEKMLDEVERLFAVDNYTMGMLKEGSYKKTVKILKDIKQLKKNFSYNEFFKKDVVDAAIK